MTSVLELTCSEVKSCVFVINKLSYYRKHFFKWLLPAKIWDHNIHNIAFSSGKMVYHCLETKNIQNSSKQICLCILMWGDFFHWSKRYFELVFWPKATVSLNPSWWIFFFNSCHKPLTDGLESCGLLMDYCDVFGLSFSFIFDGLTFSAKFYFFGELHLYTFKHWVLTLESVRYNWDIMEGNDRFLKNALTLYSPGGVTRSAINSTPTSCHPLLPVS